MFDGMGDIAARGCNAEEDCLGAVKRGSTAIPIFSRSSSSSDGRAPSKVGAAGKPTYFATPAITETS